MISVIAGTNRPNSNSAKVAELYVKILTNKGQEAKVLRLETLPVNFAFNEMWGERSEQFEAIIEHHISAASKFLFVIAEYNGSFPGVLKTFIDALPPQELKGKRAGLVGLSAGRAGALRGMDHFTGVLHYLGVEVLSNKPKLSSIDSLTDDNGHLTDEEALKLLQDHAALLIGF